MDEAKFVYKCRICGEEEGSSFTGWQHAYNSVFEIIMGQHNPLVGVGLKMTNFHNCKDGSIGVTDFIGCRRVKKKKGE